MRAVWNTDARPFAVLLLAGFLLIAQFAGCERKQQRANPIYITVPGGYERVPPEKIPANIDARLLRPWKEDAEFDAAGSPMVPVYPVSRFWFYPDGSFAVNWRLFEADYWEYWGDYTANKETGEMVLKMTDGNDKPADFVGRGTYSFDSEGRLVLSGIWLGTPREHPAASAPATTHYGHRFRDTGDYAPPKQAKR